MEFPQIENHTIHARIGGGAQADVFKGLSHATKRDVAIKVIKDPTGIDRIRREVDALSRLNHCHVVEVLGTGVVKRGEHYSGSLWLSMSLYDISFDRLVPLDAMRVVDVGVQVSSALHAAHRADVIHRDVKPANILRWDRTMVRLADFGIADDLQLRTGGDRPVGSWQFMAPEVLDGARADERSDQYSLAITLLSLLTDGVPFPRALNIRDENEFLEHKRANPPSVPATCPSAVAEVLRRGAAWDPRDRYGDLRMFGHELIAVQRDLGWPVTKFVGEPEPEPEPIPETDFWGHSGSADLQLETTDPDDGPAFDWDAHHRVLASFRNRRLATSAEPSLEQTLVPEARVEEAAEQTPPPVARGDLEFVELEYRAKAPAQQHEPRPELFQPVARSTQRAERRPFSYWTVAAIAVLVAGISVTLVMWR